MQVLDTFMNSNFFFFENLFALDVEITCYACNSNLIFVHIDTFCQMFLSLRIVAENIHFFHVHIVDWSFTY